MTKFLVRVISFLLVVCLLAEPAAAALRSGDSGTMSIAPFPSVPVSCFHLFQEQALAPRALAQRHAMAERLTAGLWEQVDDPLDGHDDRRAHVTPDRSDEILAVVRQVSATFGQLDQAQTVEIGPASWKKAVSIIKVLKALRDDFEGKYLFDRSPRDAYDQGVYRIRVWTKPTRDVIAFQIQKDARAYLGSPQFVEDMKETGLWPFESVVPLEHRINWARPRSGVPGFRVFARARPKSYFPDEIPLELQTTDPEAYALLARKEFQIPFQEYLKERVIETLRPARHTLQFTIPIRLSVRPPVFVMKVDDHASLPFSPTVERFWNALVANDFENPELWNLLLKELILPLERLKQSPENWVHALALVYQSILLARRGIAANPASRAARSAHSQATMAYTRRLEVELREPGHKRGFIFRLEGWLRDAVEADSHDIEIKCELVKVLLMQNRAREAQVYADAAVQMAPHNAQARVMRAKVFAAQGQYDAAESEFQEALRLRPRLRSAKDGLKKLASSSGKSESPKAKRYVTKKNALEGMDPEDAARTSGLLGDRALEEEFLGPRRTTLARALGGGA